MKTLLSVFILFSVSLFCFSQRITLSEQAQIRVITCGPDQDELYSAFGHSAYRVMDPVTGIDFIYNYGVFDFDQPNFYLNFTRGNLNYMLARYDYYQFRDFYIRENRSFFEQLLNLTPNQKQKLFDYLEWNNQPENRYYLYDYFYNNCATKIKESIVVALGSDIEFPSSYGTEDKTIRDLTDQYLTLQPWGDLGIDICLGLPMDIPAESDIPLFLPDYIRIAFDKATIAKGGEKEPLVHETITTYLELPEAPPEAFFSPRQLFWGLLVLVGILSLMDYMKRKRKLWLDILLFSVTGLLGLFLALLWFATDHAAAAYNLNLLWALPFNLILVWFLIRKHPAYLKYFKWSGFWYLFLAIIWFFLPQQMNPSLFPVVILLGIRSALYWRSATRDGA